ncbi:hypothetical protein BDL97_13G057100 [Sphagnum fallax]|nr:hypothetical protein BDL97_13G057100 [Sphagnum fallax]
MPIALRSIHAQTSVARHDCGSRSARCYACGAKMWLQEIISQSTMINIRFTMCCNNGAVQLPLLQQPPEVLRGLLSGSDPRSPAFREKIRMYNLILSFTSTGARIQESVIGTRSVYAFRIQGEMYHRIGSLLPQHDAQPRFCQLYIYDTTNQLQHRQNIMSTLDPDILHELQTMLSEVNPYA